MKYKLLSLVPAILILMGCQNEKTLTEVITFKPSDYEVIFIPNNYIDETNQVYMDAMIDLKAEYPNEFEEAKKEAKNLTDLDSIDNIKGPSLIIVKNDTPIAQLSGEKAKKDIMEQLEFTFGENQKKDVPN
ncbi:hypothetical protein [Oceanobacillus damuensis]|uniref:hypothetical protein n=1 Tax=Oceanobacillus damuensis TaxID=937928 RepID=UPI00082CB7E1|nr:hypothetical protein [Oceanobacillus damuensis]